MPDWTDNLRAPFKIQRKTLQEHLKKAAAKPDEAERIVTRWPEQKKKFSDSVFPQMKKWISQIGKWIVEDATDGLHQQLNKLKRNAKRLRQIKLNTKWHPSVWYMRIGIGILRFRIFVRRLLNLLLMPIKFIFAIIWRIIRFLLP